jgi:hypothetical protein
MKSECHAACGTLIHRGGIVNILRNLGERIQNQAPAGSMGPGRRRNRHWLLQGEVQAVMMDDYRPTEF